MTGAWLRSAASPPPARPRLRPLAPAAVALGVVLAMAATGFLTGFGSVGHLGAGSADGGVHLHGAGEILGLAGTILVRNGSIMLMLFSGVVTAGVSTAVGLTLLALYVGATLGAAAGNVGLAPALGSILSYAPLEFMAFLIAAVAGMLPMATAGLFRRDAGSGPRDRLRAYITSLSAAVRLLVVATLGVLAADLAEVTTIALR